MDDYPELLGQLEQRFGPFDSANFEDVLSELYEADNVTSAGLRSGLVGALRQYFDEVRSDAKPYAYTRFAREIVANGDCVITFNYDVSVERELRGAGKWEVGDGYGSPVQLMPQGTPRTKVKVLKLHGSTNWVALLFGGGLGSGGKIDPNRPYGKRPVLYEHELQFLGYQGLRDPLAIEGSDAGAHVTMIPPERPKKFWWADLFDHLWDKAKAALGTSEEIVLVGYSLPLADERARAMILNPSNSRACVTVCCGRDSDRIAGEFRGSGFTNVNSFQGCTFEGWAAKTA